MSAFQRRGLRIEVVTLKGQLSLVEALEARRELDQAIDELCRTLEVVRPASEPARPACAVCARDVCACEAPIVSCVTCQGCAGCLEVMAPPVAGSVRPS